MKTITTIQIINIKKRFYDIVPERLEHALKVESLLEIARECIFKELGKPRSRAGFYTNGLDAHEPFTFEFGRDGGCPCLKITAVIGGGFSPGHPLGYKDHELTVTSGRTTC